jgi:NADH-quinone oxidoreductase subunit G
MGFTRTETPLAALRGGDVLIVADEELAQLDATDAAKAGAVIVIGTTLPAWARHAANVVLPIANFSEEEGTFTNLRGRVQRFLQAKAAPGIARPSYFVLGDLLAAMGEGSGYWTAGQTFDALAAQVPAFAGLSYDGLGLRGAMTAGALAEVSA